MKPNSHQPYPYQAPCEPGFDWGPESARAADGEAFSIARLFGFSLVAMALASAIWILGPHLLP